MSEQAEPSIEDILASIRQIIAEDDQAEAAKPAAQSPPVAAASSAAPEAPKPAEGSSLSAALMAKAEAAATRKSEPAPIAEQTAEGDDVLNLTQILDDDGGVRDVAAMSKEEKKALHAVDQAVATEVASAFAAIRGAMAQAEEGGPSAALEDEGDIALAQAVEDTVRPLIKSWLDANLAPLVERIVREQVQQLAKR